MLPFLKWPGGKRWFVSNYASLLPSKYGRYIEPFLGGGSVYFHLQPAKALLGDLNADLVETYNAIRDDWRSIKTRLDYHQAKHGEHYYYAIRRSQPCHSAARAARLIYLNRTCFNGIYRVNRRGEFNVPKGTKDTVIFGFDDFDAVSRLLKEAKILAIDFEELIDRATCGDLIFADPPYTVRHNSNAFIKYNEKLFSWADQIRLMSALARARDRGAIVVSTNANHPSLRKLYSQARFKLKTVTRFSSISANAGGRNKFEEAVILGNVTEE
jgi:DNA adenine methylase